MPGNNDKMKQITMKITKKTINWDMVTLQQNNAEGKEQGLTSHQTHYRSYQGRVFTGQMTQPTV